MIPYDAKVAGEFMGDAIRQLFGFISFHMGRLLGSRHGVFSLGPLYTAGFPTIAGTDNSGQSLNFDASLVVPTAPENRPASISVNKYIAY